MEAVKLANLALRFILELCALAALAYWGIQAGDSPLTKIFLGVGAPLVAAIIWGLFVAPKAKIKVPGPVHIALQVLVFGSAVVGLVLAGQATLGWIFAALVIVNALLLYIWKE